MMRASSMRSASAWRGKIFIGPRWLAYVGPIGVTAAHAHHAFQIVRVLEGELELGDGRGTREGCRDALIPPDTRHAIAGSSARAMLLFLDPDAAVGRRLRQLGVGPAVSEWTRAGAPLSACSRTDPATTADWSTLTEELTTRLVGPVAPPALLHPAIRRLVAELPSRLDEKLRLGALASEVGLSSGRLGHLFTDSVGVPLRPYVLWLRIQRAACALQRGASLTSAAHAAGFSDSAHLSNVFRRMFGLAPSTLTDAIDIAGAAPGAIRERRRS